MKNKKLLDAVADENIDEVKKFLGQEININERYEGGWTALLCATNIGNKEIAKLLIDNNADVNVFDSLKESLLNICVIHNRYDMLKMILEKDKVFCDL
jgi:ankyrin repeat protein